MSGRISLFFFIIMPQFWRGRHSVSPSLHTLLLIMDYLQYNNYIMYYFWLQAILYKNISHAWFYKFEDFRGGFFCQWLCLYKDSLKNLNPGDLPLPIFLGHFNLWYMKEITNNQAGMVCPFPVTNHHQAQMAGFLKISLFKRKTWKVIHLPKSFWRFPLLT